jgi:transcriptional regulator with PAS, ATPase and Fis domain
MQKARRLSNFVPVAEQEKLIILKALAELDGDRLIAARMLGVDTAALYRKPSRELD